MIKRHLPYLDGMRGLAALYVVLHHAFLQSWPTDELQAALHQHLFARPLFFVNYGHFAVTVFIAISGFCLALPQLDRKDQISGAGKFFFRRARRILPPYYAAVVLASLLTLCMHHADLTRYSKSLPVTQSDLITHFLLIHNLNPAHYSKIAGPFWSIAVECQIYLFCPFIFLVLRHYGRNWTLALCAILAAASLLYSGLFYHSSPPGIYFVDFGLGVYFADYAVKAPRRWFGRLAAASSTVTFVILFEHLNDRGEFGKPTDVILGVAASAFMAYGLIKPHARVAAFLSHRSLVGLGLFSYSLYLLHFPLLQIFWEQAVFPLHLSRLAGFLFTTTLGTLLILFISFAFYWIFERPFVSAATKKTSAAVFESPSSATQNPLGTISVTDASI